MGETENATSSQHSGDNTEGVGAKIAYTLFFFPVIAFYPFYSVYANSKEDIDIEEKMGDSPLNSTFQFSPNYMLIPIVFFLLLIIAFLMIGSPLALIAIGFGVLFTLKSREDYERELLKRIGLVIITGISLGLAVATSSIIFVGTPLELPLLAEPILVTTFGAVYGGCVSNGYIIKEQKIEEIKKRKGESSSSSDHTETKSYTGDDISNKKGKKVLKKFVESTWVAPDDLVDNSNVEKTRKIEPLRYITRKLKIKEVLYEKKIPNTQFSKEKSNHRSDYKRRERVSPDGFKSATYTFYKPRTKNTESCDNCSGRGELDCTNCRRGSVKCSRCSGSGKTQCRKCGGESNITVDEKCGACRGSGEKSNGFTCNRCSGYGTIEKTKNCPKCRSGRVNCSKCGGSGKVTCSSCSGKGTHDCGKCDACGKLATYEYVERNYSPKKNVSYRNKSVPTSVIKDADGKRIEIDTNDNPKDSNLYRVQDETRKIPVTVATYKYLGDKWEVFDVEGSAKAREFPRDYSRQFKVVVALLFISILPLLYVVNFGI
jgi:hypothetical protein